MGYYFYLDKMKEWRQIIKFNSSKITIEFIIQFKLFKNSLNNYEGKYDKRFFILTYNSYYQSI